MRASARDGDEDEDEVQCVHEVECVYDAQSVCEVECACSWY